MKRQFCCLAVTTLLSFAAASAAPQDASAPPPPPSAQGPGQRAPMDPNRQLARLTKELKLTPDQQNQIKPILMDRQQQFDAIRNDSSLSQSDRHAKMQTLRADSETKLKAVLTDDQKKKYDDMQQRMRERMQERRHQEPDAGSNPTN